MLSLNVGREVASLTRDGRSWLLRRRQWQLRASASSCGGHRLDGRAYAMSAWSIRPCLYHRAHASRLRRMCNDAHRDKMHKMEAGCATRSIVDASRLSNVYRDHGHVVAIDAQRTKSAADGSWEQAVVAVRATRSQTPRARAPNPRRALAFPVIFTTAPG